MLKSIVLTLSIWHQANAANHVISLNNESVQMCKQKISDYYKSLYKVHSQYAHDTLYLKNTANREMIQKQEPGLEVNFIPNYYDAPAYAFRSLTGGLNEGEVLSKIDSIEILDFNNTKSLYCLLKLQTHYWIIFDIEYFTKTNFIIDRIYLNDGNLLGAAIDGRFNEYISFPGHLNQTSGKVKLYAGESENSPSLGFIQPNKLFYYAPIPNSNWVKIVHEFRGKKIIGYLQKSNIAPFKKIPNNLKKSYLKNFGG